MPRKNKLTVQYNKTKRKIKKKTTKKTKHNQNKKNIKNKKTIKNRISFKNMHKKKLKKTLKKAKKKIQRHLKHIYMKGGSKIRKEVPQDPNQSKDSITSTKAAAEIANQADVLNGVKADVIEPFSSIDSSSHSVFSSQPYSLLGGSKKHRRTAMKKRMRLINRY
jgi:hypothetical protein